MDFIGKLSRFWNCLYCFFVLIFFYDFFEGKNFIYVKFVLKFFFFVLIDIILLESDIESIGNEFLFRKFLSKLRLVWFIFIYISIKVLINF